MRNFNEWFKTFAKNVYDYKYYLDFEKARSMAERYVHEYNLLNVLIGKQEQEKEFESLVSKYPSVLEAIPSLLAVRESEIDARDENGYFLYDFKNKTMTIQQYCYFMRETGLFDLFRSHVVRSVLDYALGVEAGLNSNARKNRGGTLMEGIVEKHLSSIGLKKGVDFFPQMRTKEIEERFGLNLSRLTNGGKAVKCFDFVVYHNGIVFAIEANAYGSGGSKLNETARSYKALALEAKGIDKFVFVWITDGGGWRSARNNLEETFDVLPTLYNLNDIEKGELSRLILGK